MGSRVRLKTLESSFEMTSKFGCLSKSSPSRLGCMWSHRWTRKCIWFPLVLCWQLQSFLTQSNNSWMKMVSTVNWSWSKSKLYQGRPRRSGRRCCMGSSTSDTPCLSMNLFTHNALQRLGELSSFWHNGRMVRTWWKIWSWLCIAECLGRLRNYPTSVMCNCMSIIDDFLHATSPFIFDEVGWWSCPTGRLYGYKRYAFPYLFEV